MSETKESAFLETETPLPMVSIVLVAHKAATHVGPCLDSLRAQDYPVERREFLLVHSDAGDGTREAFESWRDGPGCDERVTILPNPKRILSAGWNIALAAAKGDVIVRLDAHALAEADFLKHNVRALMERDESIVGGPRRSINPTDWSGRLVGMAERSLFGAGQAAFRRKTSPGYVDTLAHAAYHRRVFETVGGYDERLVRNQDLECHHRMRQVGFRFFFDPSIVSVHLARPTFKGMLRQKFANGYWTGLSLAVAPQCSSLRHFIPGLFVLGLLMAGALAAARIWWPLTLIAGSYCLCAIVAAIIEAVRAEKMGEAALAPLLPIVFLAMHVANGIGLICGVAAIPVKTRQWRGYEIPRPIVPKERH
ncbi:MAG: glycosyltransferase family 2 protein [Phycisphaerales bacterium]|nr:MAG: glycosyltransferase family 2 protein [Phycisphaerales bacterium]